MHFRLSSLDEVSASWIVMERRSFCFTVETNSAFTPNLSRFFFMSERRQSNFAAETAFYFGGKD